MCVKRALWWVVVCVVVLQVSAQHWSHGLNPGGKRAALQEHSFQTVEEVPRTSSYMCDYGDVSPQNKPFRLKDLFTRVAEREMGDMAFHGIQCSCSTHHSTQSVHQTLDEMDFERGIWSAALDGDLERVRSFLKKGTDPNMKDQTGYTALHYASRAAHQQVCELLLDHCACPDSQTHGGATALHRAAYCGHISIVKLLLQHGADPALKDDDGSTPLHKAAEQGHVETCVFLLSRYPNLRTVKDNKSRLPVDLCPDHNTFLELLKPPE